MYRNMRQSGKILVGTFAMLSPTKLLGTCPPTPSSFGAYGDKSKRIEHSITKFGRHDDAEAPWHGSKIRLAWE